MTIWYLLLLVEPLAIAALVLALWLRQVSGRVRSLERRIAFLEEPIRTNVKPANNHTTLPFENNH